MYYQKKKKKRSTGGSTATTISGSKDSELLGLGRFLELLAMSDEAKDDFDDVDFPYWRDYVSCTWSFQKK